MQSSPVTTSGHAIYWQKVAEHEALPETRTRFRFGRPVEPADDSNDQLHVDIDHRSRRTKLLSSRRLELQ